MTAVLDTPTTTLADVLAFVASHADTTDLTRIHEAARQRDRALRSVRAASVVVGSVVKLDGLSPKYLNGLTGTVTSIKGGRADVTLDDTSTTGLRWSGTKRFCVSADVKNYVLPGVPLSTCTAV